MRKLFKDFGKREILVYISVFLWIVLGIFGLTKGTDFNDMAAYFGSLTAYVATYIWAESKRPSVKTSILKSGKSSRREIMIYVLVLLWTITGFLAIQYNANLAQLATYFVSLSGFIASWIAGEVYRPQDSLIVEDDNPEIEV
tara:strand:+ start:6547 stop:6972 length:426 start_codon:yes stop_codon:yes gene_type:complete